MFKRITLTEGSSNIKEYNYKHLYENVALVSPITIVTQIVFKRLLQNHQKQNERKRWDSNALMQHLLGVLT